MDSRQSYLNKSNAAALSPKARVCTYLDPKTCDRVNEFMAKAHHNTISSAVLELVKMGLAVYEMEGGS